MTAMLGVFWPHRTVWNLGYTTFHPNQGEGIWVLTCICDSIRRIEFVVDLGGSAPDCRIYSTGC
jgi:hypothetical protein